MHDAGCTLGLCPGVFVLILVAERARHSTNNVGMYSSNLTNERKGANTSARGGTDDAAAMSVVQSCSVIIE